MQETSESLFSLGNVVATPGAITALKEAEQTHIEFIRRHVSGDWGDMPPEDKEANDEAITHEGEPERQGRVFSAYETTLGVRLWVITEWDRSATTLLLPNEY